MKRDSRSIHFHSNRGTALVLLMIVIVVSSLIAVWGLSSSRQGVLKAGIYRASVATQYDAETALQKTLQRIQEIVDPDVSDSLKDLHSPSTDQTIDFLLSLCDPPGTDAVAQPGTCGSTQGTSYDVPCSTTFDPNTDFDVVTQNVICNFMGTTLSNTQVSLVRKQDYIQGADKAATFLVNTISIDPGGRRKIVQGVIVVPYQGTAAPYTPDSIQKPYIATTLKGAGG